MKYPRHKRGRLPSLGFEPGSQPGTRQHLTLVRKIKVDQLASYAFVNPLRASLAMQSGDMQGPLGLDPVASRKLVMSLTNASCPCSILSMSCTTAKAQKLSRNEWASSNFSAQHGGPWHKAGVIAAAASLSSSAFRLLDMKLVAVAVAVATLMQSLADGAYQVRCGLAAASFHHATFEIHDRIGK